MRAPRTGIGSLLLIVLGFVASADDRKIARVCADSSNCGELAVENDIVEFVSTGGFVGRRAIGHYVANDQALVGEGEAPILDLRSGTDWHVVLAAGFFYGYDPAGPTLVAYLFDGRGKLWTRFELQMSLESYEVGDLFGYGQEFLQVTTGGKHAYVVDTDVWLLPKAGPPKLLVHAHGVLDRIQAASAVRPGGLWIDTQTYDGIHSETKGWRPQFWRWDKEHLRFEAENP
jgi:hypothetical protein